MTAQGTDISSFITLEGASSFIVDFFECTLSSILMLRGVYPEDDFKPVTRYGTKVYLSNTPELTSYIDKILNQLKVWLKSNTVHKLVLAIISTETFETIERWHFDIQVNGENGLPMIENVSPKDAAMISKRTKAQIQTVLRQIVSSVSYLPTLEGEYCSFKVLVYTDKDVEVPDLWQDDDACLIPGGGEHVRLKSVSTLVHNIEPFVAYKHDAF